MNVPEDTGSEQAALALPNGDPLSRRAFLQRTSAAVGVAVGAVLERNDALALPSTTGRLALVRDGQAAAVIVTAAGAPETVAAAARELQHYLLKMSGATLPVVTDEVRHEGALVLVGRSRVTDEIPGLDIPTGRTSNLRDEGFVIWCDGNRLVLAGNDTEPFLGTRYAVCEMLHRWGVRWFMPGEFGEIVPARRTVEVERMSIRQQPAFPLRDFWEHSQGTMEAEREEWKIHNKMNPQIQRWIGAPNDGSIDNYLPHGQFKAHPEWFALRRDGSRDPHMACMTSAGMIAHFIERVKEDARRGKRVSAFAPEDGAPRCYDDGCLKLSTAMDGFGSNDRDPAPETSTSQEWFYFVDQVLQGVNKEFPEHRIAANGYSNRESPPDLPGFNSSQNMVIMFANIVACTIHAYDDPRCWQMQRQARMIKRWVELSDKVWIYNYNYTMLVHKGTLTPMVHRIRRNIPLLKEWGAIGFLDQDESDWSMSGIATRLVRARLEWNTGANVEAILEDFYTVWFGRAARPIRAYYDALERAFASSSAHGHEDVILPRIYTDGLMVELHGAMDEAVRRAGTETEKLHVRLESLGYQHLTEYMALEKAKQSCRYGEAVQHVDRMIALKAGMNKITPFMGWRPYPVYDDAWEKERMQGLLGKTTGPEGKLIAVLPEGARFRTDPFDDGRYERWQEPQMDESRWRSVVTTAGWESQGLQDPHGHPYRGIAWYRLQVDVPAQAAGQTVHLFAPAAINELWLWVNGHYVGHRPYQSQWTRPQQLDLDISDALKPGRANQVTFRVLCNTEVFGANGIYERMFLYGKRQG